MTDDQIYETSGHLLMPSDPEAPQRALRLRGLGLGQGPDPQLDEFARELAFAAGQLVGSEQPPFAMVNFVTDQQYLGGLYAPGPDGEPQLGREVPLDHGYCPHVVVRRKALVLDDVCDYPRFAGNPVVDKLGIRTYVGAPLIDDTGAALGTICIIDSEPRPWGHPGLDLIKGRAADLMRLIRYRAGRTG
ncbi:MAG TPA: GAF domain-containing protein [Streptosporangiaceae bacterium]